ARLAAAMEDGAVVQPARAVAAAAERLARGVPWMSAGEGFGVRDASAVSRGLAVWLFEMDGRRVARSAGVLAVVTHKDPTCAAACAAFARAVGAVVSGEAASPERLCGAMAASAAEHDPALAEELRHLPRLLSWEVERATELIRRVGVSAALGLGGEADAAAAVAGALLGAGQGEACLPPRLRRHVLGADRLIAAADALLEARLARQAHPAAGWGD